MSKVSIVIPVFNSGKYIKECLDSVLAQKYENTEIICVDDGSTDDSLAILNQYAEDNNKIHVYQQLAPSNNAAKARNLGLKKASGEYVLFLDSDDFFDDSLVSAMVEVSEQNNSDIVICGADQYNQKLEKITGSFEKIELNLAPSKASFSYKDCPEVIFQIGEWVIWNKLFRRQLLIDNDIWFDDIPISDDQYVATIAVVLADSISIVNKPLIHYRYNTGLSQVDNRSNYPEASYKQFQHIVNRLKEMNLFSDIKRSYVNMAIRQMRLFFDIMQDVESMHGLYDEFRNHTFKLLEADNLNSEYFYDFRIAEWYNLIKNNTFEELLFKTARGYGASMTTGILRFQVPYNEIKKGARIILVGRGVIGRYWYSQLLLSEYAEVVAWVDTIDEIYSTEKYDQVIIAK